jgi:hypothetical protein
MSDKETEPQKPWVAKASVIGAASFMAAGMAAGIVGTTLSADHTVNHQANNAAAPLFTSRELAGLSTPLTTFH